jgi:Flp pilus assembly protein TadG
MLTKTNLKNAATRASAFARKVSADVGGFAAVEFAMIVPVMIVMLLGTVEISDAMIVKRRIDMIGDTVSNAVSRCDSGTTLTAADLKGLMRVSDSLIGRYSHQSLSIQIVSLVNDNAGNVVVDWSYDSSGGQPYGHGANYPGSWNGLVLSSNSLIVAKATYSYRSPVGQFIHGSINLSSMASYPSQYGPVKFQ